jgi:LL-diaminopimelate aminotransferase
MIPTARRMQHLTPHFFASHGERVRTLQSQGVDVIRLDEGAPDLPPANFIIEALNRSAVLPDRHSYQPHSGSLQLRQAWTGMYKRVYNVELDPDRQVIPLMGSKEGIFHLSLAYIDAGDLALAPDPGYVTYTRGALFAGGDVYAMPLLAERAYLPDLEAIPAEVLSKAKLLWLNYPNNPTAATATLEFFAQAVELAHTYDLLLCHDAAYTQVTFDGRPAPSLLQVPGASQVAVEFNTLSKSHNMAGWRTGAVLGNSEALGVLYRLKTNADSSHFLPIFEASIAAMNGDQAWLQIRNQTYRQRRDVVIADLSRLGLHARKPQASLYVWSPVPQGWSSVEFVGAALENARVSLTPGTVFGAGGEGFVRIALTAPVARLEEAMDRLKEWMDR